MSTDAESLVMLERLLEEFYASNTDNARKKQIEETLSRFTEQQLAWKYCLFFISNTRNEFVLMFCLNVIENLINRQWMGVKDEDRLMIRSTIQNLLLHNRGPNELTYVRNKMAKLIVLIARHDWPHSFPDFFSNILMLSQQRENVDVSLVLLHLTSEELATPRDGELSFSRANELRQLLLHQVPVVLSLLANLLDMSLERHKVMVSITATATPTPPPSPTRGHVRLSNEKHLKSTSIKQSLQLHKGVSCDTSSTSLRFHNHHPFDPTTQSICSLSLQCLIHLFSWIPLSSSITPSIVLTVFRFAEFGCQPDADEQQRRLGELAMNCVNELLTKNCVPPEFEEFLLMMFNQTFHLLQCLTKNDEPSRNNLQRLDENYLDKFTEFLHLFVRLHLRRFESNSHFNTLSFLELIFRYTFKQLTNEGFFNCLSVWSEFLDCLTSKLEERSTTRTTYLAKYETALLSLASDILKKIQFRFNQSQLDLLDDDVLDDDFKTEWQYFLAECLEIVAKVTQLYPPQMFALLYEPFQVNMTVYFGLENFITTDVSTSKRQLNVTAENDCRRLHCALRDLSSFLQAYGRLSNHFTGDNFMQTIQDGCSLVEKLIQVSVYGTKLKLYDIGSTIKNVLEGDFIEVHAQSMSVVKAYSSWLSQFCQQSRDDQSPLKDRCDQMIAGTLDTVVPLLLEKTVPEKVTLSASHLLLSVCTTVRPAYLYRNPLLQRLYEEGIKVQHCPPEVELLTFRALSHYLLLPWPGLPDTKQEWESRSHSLAMFLNRLLVTYKSVCDIPGLSDNAASRANAKWCIGRSLSIMTDIVENLSKDGVSRSKQICHLVLQQYIHLSLHLVPMFVDDYETTYQFLGFFLALFQTVRVQMGAEFVEKIIQAFLNLFSRELILGSLHLDRAYGHQLVDRFLRLLQVIVLEPGNSFKKFLPSILQLCLSEIYPVLSVRDSPDVKPTLFDLLNQFLQHQWKFFFGATSALDTVNRQTNENVENKEQFVQIMQAYGQSFMQTDISLFRQNLESLESLNTNRKLYQKLIFRNLMLNQFINVLLQTLLQRTHSLLQEEITSAIYNMASVDFNSFYEKFIPEFLSVMKGINYHQQSQLVQIFRSETDYPSFMQNIHYFINDLRFYHLSNSSLPEGSVKL